MKSIKTKTGEDILVDDEWFDMLSLVKWFVVGHRGSSQRRPKTYAGHAQEKMHRIIMNVSTWNNVCIDHINGNKLDNRRCNLRLCTHKGNAQNRSTTKNKYTHYKGISFDKTQKLWRAVIGPKGNRKGLGRSKCEHKAAMRYDIKAIELYREFAWPNNATCPLVEHVSKLKC